MDKTVILCDPDPHLTQLYRSHLEEEAITLVGCCNPEKLESMSLHIQPDLILISANLGENCGYQLCRKLKQNLLNQSTPIIMLSDCPNLMERQQAEKVGAQDLINRICSAYFLNQRIRNSLFKPQHAPVRERMRDYQFQVLVAEDSPSLQQYYRTVLESLNCQTTLCDNGEQAWKALQTEDQYDLIISDLFMPVMDGKELCYLIRSHHEFDQIPILLISTEQEKQVLYDLLSQGVNDYIQKPFREMEMRARISVHLRNRSLLREQFHLSQELIELSADLEDRIAERTQSIFEANVATIYKLATACDLKDDNTANHIARVRDYVERFSLHIGLDPTEATVYGYSSMMHDVGKLGIPDVILKKPGPLNKDEWKIMRTHPIQGKKLLGNQPFYQDAADIAVAHHERYDGNGYPYGLKGDQIPLSARIVAIVDIYDALTNRRPYKEPWSVEESFKELDHLAGNHLDPLLVSQFLQLGKTGELQQIQHKYQQH